jgi:hypothetical protein
VAVGHYLAHQGILHGDVAHKRAHFDDAPESRRLETLRLETCRMIAGTGTTTQNIPIPAQKSSSIEGIDWGSVTFGQLCRIGWGVFFPFIVAVLIASLLIGAAVIAAFNGSIRW